MDANFWLGFIALFVTILGAAFTLGGKLSGIRATLEGMSEWKQKTDENITGLNTAVSDLRQDVAVQKVQTKKNEEAITRLEKQVGMV